MRHDIYLLSSIIQPGFWNDLTVTEQGLVTEFLQDMQQGPADGEVDVQWQETNRGYYTHLEILERLKVEKPQAVEDYVAALESDIAAWLAIKPNKYEVLNLKEILNQAQWQ